MVEKVGDKLPPLDSEEMIPSKSYWNDGRIEVEDVHVGKLVVYKGFDEAFLSMVKEEPLVDGTIATKLNVLEFDKKTRKQFEKAYSLEKNEIIISNLAILKNHFEKYEQSYFLYKELLKTWSKEKYYISIVTLLINLTICSCSSVLYLGILVPFLFLFNIFFM